MGLRINNNIISQIAQHKLSANSAKLATSLERLSSGLRINKGADDVVGLLKSESLRAQIRGITAAEGNLTNARNLLGVAEGALAQLTDLAQRVREKVVQAADNTISSSDRTNLTTAISDLTNEYSRIATATNFDNVKLIDGTFTSKTFQVGPSVGDTISLTISDARSPSIGQVALFTAVTLTARGSHTSSLDLSAPTNLTINGVTLASSAFSADGVSNADTDESAIAYVNAINSVAGQSGVQARVLANVVTIDFSATGEDDMTSTTYFVLNGITLTSIDVDFASATDQTTFVNIVNDQASRTGVTAAYNSSASVLTFTAADGRNIDFLFTGGSQTAMDNIMGTGMGSLSIGVVYRGTFRLFSDSAFTSANGTTVLGSSASSVAVSTAQALNSVNIATSTNAETAIFILDNVIRQLQTRRASVGSATQRMEVAASELETRKENLTDSESKIRDADVAEETARLTSAQILQQAGVQVLARANAIPQIALTLLQA